MKIFATIAITLLVVFNLTGAGFVYYHYSDYTALKQQVNTQKSRQVRIMRSVAGNAHVDCRTRFFNSEDIRENKDNIEDIRYPATKRIRDKVRKENPYETYDEASERCEKLGEDILENLREGRNDE